MAARRVTVVRGSVLFSKRFCVCEHCTTCHGCTVSYVAPSSSLNASVFVNIAKHCAQIFDAIGILAHAVR